MKVDVKAQIYEALSDGVTRLLGERFNRSCFRVPPARLLRHIADGCNSGYLTQEEWRAFVLQRDIVAREFEGLLETGIEKAKISGYAALQGTLKSNLRDEQGVDLQGNPLSCGSHAEWRRELYHAVGISDEQLATVEPTIATTRYLREEGTALMLAGAVLFQEYAIPKEFEMLLGGAELAFMDTLFINNRASSREKEAARKARLYYAHHIAHDEGKHYPELEAEVLSCVTEKTVPEVIEGIKEMAHAKTDFYDYHD